MRNDELVQNAPAVFETGAEQAITVGLKNHNE